MHVIAGEVELLLLLLLFLPQPEIKRNEMKDLLNTQGDVLVCVMQHNTHEGINTSKIYRRINICVKQEE